MFATFNMLRANDLFWSFYVNNYLLGRPRAFRSPVLERHVTRMPRKTHMYLREMYLKNNLVGGAIELAGVPIDLTRVDARLPAGFARGPSRRIRPCSRPATATPGRCGSCSRSGHIAGVINPPAQGKYQFW